MRTGLKTAARTLIYKLKHPALFNKNRTAHRFPDSPVSSARMRARFDQIQSELQHRNVSYNLGSLYTLPHPSATRVYKRFIDYNPGNLGSWSDDESKTRATTTTEYEVVHKLIDLYHGSHATIRGHVTSGGTEGNIFALWLGRTYLTQQYKKNTLCVLKTDLTHYSVRKAALICDVAQHRVPLHASAWNMDPVGFAQTVRLLYAQGFRGFLVPLTLGYTATGTCDDIGVITHTATILQKELAGLKFFFWVDAALNGLIAPFLDRDFRPFKTSAIQVFLVDFHKFGLVPYPAGIILYRKSLKPLIERPVDYLSETDATLLGSRSGIPATSMWAVMHTLGKSGYIHLVEQQLKNKNYFIDQIKTVSPAIDIVTHFHSLSCGVIFRTLHNQRLPRHIERKYGLYPGETRTLFFQHTERKNTIYSFFFLPHVRQKVVSEFIRDLRKTYG